MAYRVVEESSLTGIADAIRESGRTGDSLLFPSGFCTAISNLGGSGGSLTVNAPAGVLVSAEKYGKSKTKMTDESGIAVFKGLETGIWTLTITDGIQTASKTVEIVADYATSITFFAATISITYPPGAVCTVTCGSTTLIAPDNSGTWACSIPSAGTWEVVSGNYRRFLTIANGDNKTADVTKLLLFDHGDDCSNVTGGWITRAWKQNAGFTDSEAVAPALNVTDGCIVITPMKTSGYAGGAILPANDFNMGLYTKFCVKVEGFSVPSGGFVPYAQVSERSLTYWADAPAIISASTVGTVTLSFSFSSGNKAPYIAIRCVDANADCCLKISQMWLE